MNYIYINLKTLLIVSFIACTLNASAQKKSKVKNVPYQQCHVDSSIVSAIIYIIRPDKGIDGDIKFTVNDSLFNTSKSKGSYYQLNSFIKGPIEISTGPGKASLAFDVSYGRVYYLLTELGKNGKTKLKIVDPPKGYAELDFIKNPPSKTQGKSKPF